MQQLWGHKIFRSWVRIYETMHTHIVVGMSRLVIVFSCVYVYVCGIEHISMGMRAFRLSNIDMYLGKIRRTCAG